MNASWAELLDSVIGRVLIRTARVLFVHGDSIGSEGPIELDFGDGVLVFRCGGDGQRLEVSSGPWVDPFGEPLSDENRAWVADHGAWRRFERLTPELAALEGHQLSAVEVLELQGGSPMGVVLDFGIAGSLRVEAVADELHLAHVGESI